MILATAGLAADLSGIALWMLVAPGLEAGELGLLERIAGALSLFVAKILYSAAGTLLALAGRREMGAPLTLLSLGVWLAGLSVAGTTLCGCGLAQLYSLGILVILFIVWSTLLGLRFLGIRPERGATEGPLFTPDPRD